MSPRPSFNDINVFDSLDERSAAEHFFGKDLQQAEEMFRENFLYFSEDLSVMGPRAFCYYVRAAIAYLTSPASTGDSDAVSCFCSAVEGQLRYNPDEIRPAHRELRDASQNILSEFERFSCDPQIYGNIEARYCWLNTYFATAT